MTTPDTATSARSVLVGRLTGHAMGLAEYSRYAAGSRSNLTNADVVSYGTLLLEAADRIAALEAGLKPFVEARDEFGDDPVRVRLRALLAGEDL